MTDRPAVWAYVTRPADLGDFLRRRRTQRGLTQAALADELGITRRYLVEIEQGKPSLYTDRLFALLRELDIVLKVEAP
jgi:HTH-type transcriptional regulator/antitoxin HipB